MGVQACRLPAPKPLKPSEPLKRSQPTGIPRPHQWLLMGVQACRLPAPKPLKPSKPLKRLKPLQLSKLSQQASQGHINGFLWAPKLAVCQPLNP